MPITVADIANHVQQDNIFQTLGSRSIFTVTNEEGVVTIINSQNRRLVLTDELVSSVCNRYENLPINQRLVASQYGDPYWPDTPNRVFSAYVARIIHDLHNPG